MADATTRSRQAPLYAPHHRTDRPTCTIHVSTDSLTNHMLPYINTGALRERTVLEIYSGKAPINAATQEKPTAFLFALSSLKNERNQAASLTNRKIKFPIKTNRLPTWPARETIPYLTSGGARSSQSKCIMEIGRKWYVKLVPKRR